MKLPEKIRRRPLISAIIFFVMFLILIDRFVWWFGADRVATWLERLFSF